MFTSLTALVLLVQLATVVIQNVPDHIPTGIGIWEYKGGQFDKWLVCKDEAFTESIVDLYFKKGMMTASDTWDAAINSGDCLAVQGWMMPQAVVYHKKEFRVVRVANKDNQIFYWFTIDEPVVGEVPLK